METILHRAEERGRGDHGWLTTRYSFSFANWYEPARMGFGALRVLNDDTIAPSSGFPMHAHRDMEIITLVTGGTLTHRDSLGTIGTVHAGEVQVMSAGTGITHSEYNASDTEPLALFQIWIETAKEGSSPRYAQRAYPPLTVEDGIRMMVGPEGASDLAIGQEAFISRTLLAEGRPQTYELRRRGNGLYVFVIAGTVSVAEELLRARDGLGVVSAKDIALRTEDHADVLLIEVPV